MSLATRCTHCGTIFKVVQDQLKVSEGWVRCGRCNEVFNALPTLFDLDKDPPPPRQTATPPVTPPATPPAEPPPPVPAEPGFQPVGEPAAPPQVPPSEEHLSPAEASALTAQGLLSDDLDVGLDSQPPAGWERTQPADFVPSKPPGGASHALSPDDLALDPTPIEATTDFELDTAIAVDDNTPLEVVLAAMSRGQAPTARPAAAPPVGYADEAPMVPTAPVPVHEPAPMPEAQALPPAPAEYGRFQPLPETPAMPLAAQPWLSEPPEDVPSTDESDALDSRYLMPSDRERRAPRRPGKGPEFADAEFPTDAMIDAEEDWASDFGPSALERELLDEQAPAGGRPLPGSATPPVTTAALRGTQSIALPPLGGMPQADDALSTQPSRFADEEAEHAQALPPPSQRAGRSGTRGRNPADKGADKTPEFLKRAQRKAFWRHPAVRGALSVLCLGLLLTLALQMAHQFRDLIAAYHPASRPYLAQWCEAVGCQIKPPLRLEALQVDNLELVRTASAGPGSYRLTVVVRNQAPIDVAWPHLDLTLTDTHGSVIARRVFSPDNARWLNTADPKADAARAGADLVPARVPDAAPSRRSTTLEWRIQAPELDPAGYTAELFYP